MTRKKKIKKRIRERMRKTGERYTAARAQVEGARSSTAVRGRVLDARTRAPLEGARVHVAWRPSALPGDDFHGNESGWTGLGGPDATTGAAGSFEVRLEAPEGRTVAAIGVVVLAAGHEAFVRELARPRFEEPLELLLDEGSGATIRGVVLDAGTGLGVEGVTVDADLSDLVPASGRLAGEERIEPATGRRTFQELGGSVGRTRTGPGGRFELTGLPWAGTARLVVEARDTYAETAVFANKGRWDHVEVRLVESASLTVKVVDPEGRPVPGAWLDSIGPGRRGPSFWEGSPRTGPDGSFTFAGCEPGARSVAVSLHAPTPELSRAADLIEHLNLAPGERRSLSVAIDPAPRGVVECRVRFASGEPATGVVVVLAPPNADWFAAREATTGAEGVARFDRLQPGSYALKAGSSVNTASAATVEVGTAAVPFALTIPDRGDLTVLVVARGGRPVRGARVLVEHLKNGERSNGVTDARGRLTLAGLPRGQAMVRVEADGLAAANTQHEIGAGDLRVELAPPRELVLRGSVDASLEGASILGLVQQERPFSFGATVGRGGMLAVRVPDSLQAGAGTVFLRIGTWLPVRRSFGPDDATLDLGALSLERGATLRGRVADGGWTGLGGFTWATAETRSLGEVRGVIAEDGTFVFEGLPVEPLELELSVFSPGTVAKAWRKARVTVDAATVARGFAGTIVLHDERAS
jgi:protocatechuate 3,4-dioxygenase beta subunit